MMDKLAPVILFAYNRPQHTAQVLDSLMQCELSDQTDLIVYCDGPKKNASLEDLENIKAVRELIHNTKWLGKKIVNESDVNLGLADSIIRGVSRILEEYPYVIVLEDDILVSRYFLTYMNTALNFYKENEKVMHISAYWFPTHDHKKLPETFFLHLGSCWGWGTWKAAWAKFESDPVKLKREIEKIDPEFKKFNLNGTSNFLDQLDRNIEGTLKTWGIKWYASIFLNKGLSLHPNISYTNNIGHDGTGDNCPENDLYSWNFLNSRKKNFYPKKTEYCKEAEESVEFYFKNMYKSSLRVFLNRLLPSFLARF